MYILRRLSMVAICATLNLQHGGVRDFYMRSLSSRITCPWTPSLRDHEIRVDGKLADSL
ncbi:putative glutamate synthase (NADH) [Helianthus annuus]|uniref:Glutamate synthase (NADH) n=1 Tax=Helianthus annuus TaxID=4232 RepID=A0A9K3MYQ4_HELAN|nr:putative glutamate synthase (NADH) [Helianthus annuus]KAJ0873811.1 putative glutamate synthase (NADH) [Helianthus annuus]